MLRFRSISSLLLLVVLTSATASASGVLKLKGTVFSILREEFVVQSGRELFYIKKDALPAPQREIYEKAAAHEVTVDVPMSAIMRVRSDGKPAGAKKR